jgi:hypothetical protein
MKNEIDKAFEITKKEKRPALISFTVISKALFISFFILDRNLFYS